ncbi:MAG TPA: alpha/beta fold hydrolase [Dehalococcoidia bacterium]|jgi:pimeloyl-ACP methyl ester carboxylesterase|nr:alpha/beta fold hydrolase [Dehalococcoidia bacterium]
MTEGFAPVPDGSVYYEVIGGGPSLVLVHAGIADCRMWDGQMPLFSQSHRVVRYDVRGFGRSSDPAGDFAHHEDLFDLLKHLSVARATIIGVSMGGTLTIDFALAHPDLVSALVLVATGPNGYDRWGAEIKQGWAEETAALEARDIEGAIEINLRMWVDGPARSPAEVDPAVGARVREMLAHNLPREGEGEAQDLEPLAVGRLDEIDVLALVIVGDKDQPDIIASSGLLAERIQGARLEVIRDTAHVPNMERPEEFNRVVLQFLDTVPA